MTELNLREALALTQILIGGGQYSFQWNEMRQQLEELYSGHCSYKYSKKESNWNIVRGRICNETVLFDNVSELSNRKESDIKDFGRCHKKGVSIFYGANNIDTVLSELKPDIGDLVHMAVAKPKIDIEVILTVIGEIDHVRRYGDALLGDKETTLEIMEMLNIEKENDLKRILLDAFMSELFIRPANQQRDYKATSALSDVILFQKNSNDEFHVDGFAYPSVAHRGGINFAIRGSAFEQKMEIYECMTFEITEYLGYGLYGKHLKARSKAIDIAGKIEWCAVKKTSQNAP